MKRPRTALGNCAGPNHPRCRGLDKPGRLDGWRRFTQPALIAGDISLTERATGSLESGLARLPRRRRVTLRHAPVIDSFSACIAA